MHGVSIRDTHLYLAAQQLISSPDNNNIRAAHWADHQWNAECADNPTRLPTFITGTYPSGMTLQRTAWVRLNQFRTGVGCFRSCLCRWCMASSAACVWRRRTNRRPCCLLMSNPSTSPWTARPNGSGQWDNRLAAQHLPRDLVRPSSGLKN